MQTGYRGLAERGSPGTGWPTVPVCPAPRGFSNAGLPVLKQRQTGHLPEGLTREPSLSGLAEHPWALREIFMLRNIESSGLRVGWEAEGPDAHPGEALARMLL